ncbi:MAG: ATP-binding cassette domain-containing protein [Chloroflexota bacterium]
MPHVIEVDHLVKRYKHSETNAVDDITFGVEPGELFAFLGPNGAGKTTTISILTTTLLPTSGKVLIDGHDVVRRPGDAREVVGIIFHKPSLDEDLTAEENVRFHAVLYGLQPFRPLFSMMPRSYQLQVRDLASILGIGDDLFTPVKRFSGGMKRKLEIVRSLRHQPKVLFLDDPTVGLDPESRRNLWEYIKDIRKRRNTTIFLTTHYLDEAEDADTICIVKKGQIVSFGSPSQVKADLIEMYVLVDAADRGVLREELRSKKLRFSETPLFKIDLDGQSVHELLKSIQTPLSTVQTHVPSLEDAYLEIVGES